MRLIAYPVVDRVSYIPGGWPWDFFHQQYYPRKQNIDTEEWRAWESNFDKIIAGYLPIKFQEGSE